MNKTKETKETKATKATKAIKTSPFEEKDAVYKTKTVEDTEMVYSILREKYRDRQIDIEFNDNTKEYTLKLTNEKFQEDPEVPVDLKIKVIYGDTDSVFLSMKFNRENFELNRKDAFKMGIICGDNLTDKIFKRPPIELEFEKVYQPFILLTKKRYIGKKFEDTRDPMKLKTVTTAGIALTRRNYSQLVKSCYKEVIDCILDTGDLQKSCDIYKNYIERIQNYNVKYEDLVVSAQIGKEYACKECKKKTEWVLRCKNMVKGKLCNEPNPHKKSHCDKCKQKFECVHSFSLAHINLAQKLLERNEDIQIGDRIQYIFIEGAGNKEQKNELAEDYNFAIKEGLKFNRVAYLEQVAKPVLGFLKVCLDETPDLLDSIIEYTNEKMVEFGGKKLRVSDFKISEDD